VTIDDVNAGGDVPLQAMTDDVAVEGAAEAARHRARELFLDDRNLYGCAETAFVVLKEAFGLPEPMDSSAAMALNGGIAYSGGTCGAVTGAALAVGMLAERRIPDHRAAKRAARLVTADLLAAFEAGFGTLACRELIEVDLRTEAGHRAFIDSGIWRDRCMRQLEMAVGRLAPLEDPATWEAATTPPPP
jgi:C_GCAxxG_C_C family probable redox protein